MQKAKKNYYEKNIISEYKAKKLNCLNHYHIKFKNIEEFKHKVSEKKRILPKKIRNSSWNNIIIIEKYLVLIKNKFKK